MRKLSRLTLLYSIILICFGCSDSIMADDVVNVQYNIQNEYTNYDFVKSIENSLVENRLVQYSQGTLSNTLDYNKEHVYNRLNIAFMTDSHLDLGNAEANRQNVIDAIDFCNNVKVPISVIIEGGDLRTWYLKDKKKHINDLNSFFDIGWNASMPLLYTKGNHDLNTINVTPDKALTDRDWSEIWFDQAEDKYHIVRNNKSNGQKSGYYYYDLTDWKVRIICVDCFDLDISQTNESGNILYECGTSFYIGNEQFNWIIDTALSFDDKEEKDWGVIVFMHAFNLTAKNGTSVTPAFSSVYPRFKEMLYAFNTQSKYKEEYSFPDNQFYNLSINCDWTRYANVEKRPYFICLLSGHIHTDDYHNYNGINHIITANQFCGEEYCDIRLNRVAGTSTQNLFDILNIDLIQRRIRVIRYGAGVNCYGVGGDRFLPNGIEF